jgi:hypothetical protein
VGGLRTRKGVVCWPAAAVAVSKCFTCVITVDPLDPHSRFLLQKQKLAQTQGRFPKVLEVSFIQARELGLLAIVCSRGTGKSSFGCQLGGAHFILHVTGSC